MKKIFVVALILCLMASISFAATAKSAIKSSEMRIGVGVDTGMAGMRFSTDTFNGLVGLAFSSTSGGGTSQTTFGFGGKLTFNLTGGQVPTHAGAGLTYTSFPAGNQTGTTFSINGIYGAETTIANNFVAGFDIYPISFSSTSVGGQSQTTIALLTGTVYGIVYF